MTFRFQAAGAGMPNRMRSDSEDSYLAAAGVIAVADGTGGGRPEQNGALASAMATGSLPHDGVESKGRALDLLRGVDGKIAAGRQTGGITTLCFVALLGDEPSSVLTANVGDSRAYVVRDGSLRLLTHDHNEAGDLTRRGHKLDAEEYRHYRRRLYNFLGSASATVDFSQHVVEPDDVFIVCTDGLYTAVGEMEMVELVDPSRSPDEIAGALVDAAAVTGPHDDVSVVVGRVVNAARLS